MKKILGLFIGLVLVLTFAVSVHAAGGFDQYGYNNSARIFNGSLSGWCNKLYNNTDNCVGSPYETWANDHLTMKWNAAWDACNKAGNLGSIACTGAWIDNEWNGMVPNGSGEVWHYKIVWNDICYHNAPILSDGGVCLWGPYEQLMSQGMDSGVHYWENKAIPNGYGVMP